MERVEEKIARLTPREREVLDKIMEGLLNKEIAFELGVSERTIKVHRGRIMEKMGAKSVAQLAYQVAEFRLRAASSREEIRVALQGISREELAKAGIV